MLWYLIFYLMTKHQSCLISPAPRDILNCVSTSSQQDHGNSKIFHVSQQLSMPSNRHIQMSQFVFGKWVGSTLDDHYIRDIWRHYSEHNFLEKFHVWHIVHTAFKGNIYSVEFADSFSNRLKRACAREEIFIELMEAHCHHSVCMVKRFLHAVSVMHVDVKVEHSWINLEQLQNAQNYVIYVTKTAGLSFFGVVVPSRPVYYDISFACN